MDQFIEIKVIHNGTIPYNKPEVRDGARELAAVNMFQNKLRGSYITKLQKKDQQNFRTQDIGPLEMVFIQMNIKPLVFSSFGEMSSNVKENIKLAVDLERSTWGGRWLLQQ